MFIIISQLFSNFARILSARYAWEFRNKTRQKYETIPTGGQYLRLGGFLHRSLRILQHH